LQIFATFTYRRNQTRTGLAYRGLYVRWDVTIETKTVYVYLIASQNREENRRFDLKSPSSVGQSRADPFVGLLAAAINPQVSDAT